MTFSDFKSHTNPLFLQLKLLKVCDIIKQQQFKLVYEFFKNLLPTDLQRIFELNNDIHSYQTNSAQNIFYIYLEFTQQPMVINLLNTIVLFCGTLQLKITLQLIMIVRIMFL